MLPFCFIQYQEESSVRNCVGIFGHFGRTISKLILFATLKQPWEGGALYWTKQSLSIPPRVTCVPDVLLQGMRHEAAGEASQEDLSRPGI